MRLEWQTTAAGDQKIGKILALSCDLWPDIHVPIIDADPQGIRWGQEWRGLGQDVGDRTQDLHNI